MQDSFVHSYIHNIDFFYDRRYVLERYVHVLLGRSHLDIPESQRQHATIPTDMHSTHHHLSPFELHGLKSIVMYLHSLPSTKKNVPELIRDPVALIHDVRCLVEQHRHDSPEAAVTGNPILPPPPALTIAERVSISRAYCEPVDEWTGSVNIHFFVVASRP